MAITALPTAPSRSSAPSTFADDADTWVVALATFTTEANALQTDVNTKQGLVAASAEAADSSAYAAAASVVAAELAETNAEAAAAAAQAAAGLTPDANFGMVLATTASTIIKTSAYTAAVGKMQDVDTSGGAIAITPPASPTVGQWFGVRDYNQSSFSGKFPWVVYGTDKIIGKAENCYIDVNTVIFTWRGATKGWCL